MFFEMVCPCSASFNIDVPKDKEDAAWLLVIRFVNAHSSCGSILPLYEEEPMRTRKQDFELKQKKDNES